MARVVLAMSGGVDSSVAAHLLVEQGHDVIGVFMRHGNWFEAARSNESAGESAKNHAALPIVVPNHKQGCCSASDAEDARRVADDLDIPFYALNLKDDFDRIIDYFVREYSEARTPNPCVVCNTWLKFGKLFEYADSVGAQYVATGHYAQVLPGEKADPLAENPLAENPLAENPVPALCRGLDPGKDQSYSLFGIARHFLRRMLLPVGPYCKDEIRRMASKQGLRVADKRDSQEICFVAPGQHAQFVRHRQGNSYDTSGQIVTTDGTVVGQHEGLENFTIGQRKGLGVALGEPRFVVRLEPESRRVVIGTREDLACRELTAKNTNWLVEVPTGPLECLAQIRYNSLAHPAMLQVLPGDRVKVTFDEPQYGVAPGQAVVCYAENRILGGGWIE